MNFAWVMQNIICELTLIPKFICMQLFETWNSVLKEAMLNVVSSYPLVNPQTDLSQQPGVYEGTNEISV